MAERQVVATNNVNSGAGADATLASIQIGTTQNEAINNLPSAPIVGGRSVRIRATVLVAAAGTGSLFIKVKNSAGTQIGVTSIATTNGAGGFAVIEVIDTAPVGPLVYSITGQATTATSCNTVMETEVVN